MKALPTSHPEANTYLQNGGFTVQGSHASPFSQIPIDQTIEQTINRDTKTKGGIVGFSLNKGAVQRWMLTAHERAAVTQNLKKMMGVKQSETSAMKETRTARISRDESDVRKVVEVLETWINPFDPSEELSSLSSGAVAPKDVKDELLGAKKIEENAAVAFMKHRIISNETELYDPISKKKLKTFSALRKLAKVSIKGKEQILRADRNLFVRMTVIAQTRDMDMREVLSIHWVHFLGHWKHQRDFMLRLQNLNLQKF